MKCPNCGFEQQAVELDECLKCHIIFSKWQNVLSNQQRPLSSAPLSPAAPKKDVSIWVGGVILLLGILLLWPLLNPKGRPIPPDAYRDETFQFAISAPPEWIRVTKSNYQELISQYKDLVPLLKYADTKDLVVGFIKMEKNTPFSPSVNIVAQKGRLPTLTESQKDQVAQAANIAMSARFSGYKQEAVNIIDVDKLKALQILSVGGLKIRSSEKSFILKRGTYYPNPNAYKKYDLKFMQVAIPGGEYYYFLTMMAEASTFDRHLDTFNKIVDSFRVLKRPLGFWGATPFGSIQVGITWGVIAFFIMAWRKRKRAGQSA